MTSVSIVGGSGYAGGELLRLLIDHPQVTLSQVTSERLAGKPVTTAHPNLRGRCSLSFCPLSELEPCDVLFVSLPNGVSMKKMKHLRTLAQQIIDLGADFRLNQSADWSHWYGSEHQEKRLMKKFVYGVPELHRQEVSSAQYVAGPGCEAMVSILSLYPIVKAGLIDGRVIIDAKMSSSQAGARESAGSHHPERAGVMRSYAPAGHRHAAEIQQELRPFLPDLQAAISATATDMVRGILVTIHCTLKKPITEKEVWQAYRQCYRDEPFIRMVKQREGLYRYPEPKILQGTNYCDIGFALDQENQRLVILGAIDNLVKGTAGNAVQCLNLMLGIPETTALTFPGLHPI